MTRPPEELLALVLDPLDDVPVVGLDSEGKVVRWTAGATRALGFAEADVLSKHLNELYTEEDVRRARPTEDLRAATQHGHSVRDGWRRRADGSRFWARTVIRSRRDDEGRLTGFALLTCDLTDQLDIERSMSATDQRFAGLVELSEDGIISTDESGLVILFNRGAERMFGYDRSEVVGRPLGMLLPERLRAAHDEHMQAFRSGARDAARMAQGRIVTGLAKDGREFPLEATISRLQLEDGAVLSVILRGASERIDVERSLRQREAVARQLADALPLPITRLDAELRHVFANRAAQEWLGRSPEDIVGMSARELLGEMGSSATWEAARLHLEAALAGRESRFAGRARRADGSVRDIETLILPTKDEAGRVDGLYTVTFDLTEGLRIEIGRDVVLATTRLLAGSIDADLMLHSSVRLATSGFADRCDVFLEAEDGTFLHVAGREGQDSVVEERIPPDEMPTAVLDVARDGVSRSFTDLRGRTEGVAVPLPCSERRPGILLLRWNPPFDVTRREVEIGQDLGARLAGAIDRVEVATRSVQAVRGRDWLMQKVSHDLGNPVAAIVMVADRLLRLAPSQDRRTRTRPLLEGIAQQAKEMELIIEELIDASALRTGRLAVRPEAADAVSILRQAVSLAEPIASARDVSLVEQLPDDSLEVVADPYHLRRALSALLSDQIAWCEAESRIHAEVSGRDGQVLFSVLGPGPDVPAEELMLLLDEGVPPEHREGGGVGPFVRLPLAIGADIVRAHGARITVTRASDGGTRYAFSLPRAPRTGSP